jgi:DNA-binding protein H-NS
MAKYRDLLKQREELEKQIAAVRQREMRSALQQVHRLISEFQLTPEVVFPPKVRNRGPRSGALGPKYRDPISGNT